MPPPSYPAKVFATADRSGVPSLSARAALDAYAANPQLRSSPTFEFLHFAVVGIYDVDSGFNVGVLELDDGRGDRLEDDEGKDSDGENSSGEDSECVHTCWAINQPWKVFDVDLEDANGTLFRTRILLNEGNADANTGCFGKVYDRADDMRVLASISTRGDSETQWFPEPGVAASFAEHAHLADLSSLYGAFDPGACDCQFTALLALAWCSVRNNGVAGSTGSTVLRYRL